MLYYTCVVLSVFFFFFSSRRRHTRSLCDWSSDVCSSDLVGGRRGGRPAGARPPRGAEEERGLARAPHPVRRRRQGHRMRSEERRVGKECRCRGSPYQEKKKRERDHQNELMQEI